MAQDTHRHLYLFYTHTHIDTHGRRRTVDLIVLCANSPLFIVRSAHWLPPPPPPNVLRCSDPKLSFFFTSPDACLCFWWTHIRLTDDELSKVLWFLKYKYITGFAQNAVGEFNLSGATFKSAKTRWNGEDWRFILTTSRSPPPHGSHSISLSYYYLGWRSPFSNFRCINWCIIVPLTRETNT